MMRLLLCLSLILLAPRGFTQEREVAKTKTSAKSSASNPRKIGGESLADALALAKAGKYKEASLRLFQLSFNPNYREQRMQIKYLLGLMLYQMKFNQVAAFQFISVVKDGNNKYIKQSLEKLSLAADQLGDDTLLNYAISRIKVDEFPKSQRDMLYYRIGEYQMRNQQYDQAIRSFSKVSSDDNLYPRAKYMEGLCYAEIKKPAEALTAFDELVDARSGKKVTDRVRVGALMGKARASYQKKDWSQAIETYREVPRDTMSWHDTLFESSWAMLRSGRFRSALSNFQSLHSAYYEDFYLPESLLLRAIVYLYICKYDEMDKVLNLFNRVYKPVFRDVEKALTTLDSPAQMFNEVNQVINDYRAKGDQVNKKNYKIPLLVVRRISQESDFQNTYGYIKKLMEETKRLKQMPAEFKSSALGKYSARVLATRMNKAKVRAGKQIKAHLIAIREDLFDLFEQEGFIRYEMINGRKESIKKRIAGKELPDDQIDEDNARDFYVQNGYEYWPFRGEFWLDELGNYHYVGTQSCE